MPAVTRRATGSIQCRADAHACASAATVRPCDAAVGSRWSSPPPRSRSPRRSAGPGCCCSARDRRHGPALRWRCCRPSARHHWRAGHGSFGSPAVSGSVREPAVPADTTSAARRVGVRSAMPPFTRPSIRCRRLVSCCADGCSRERRWPCSWRPCSARSAWPLGSHPRTRPRRRPRPACCSWRHTRSRCRSCCSRTHAPHRGRVEAVRSISRLDPDGRPPSTRRTPGTGRRALHDGRTRTPGTPPAAGGVRSRRAPRRGR